jgi:hypothetical protein
MFWPSTTEPSGPVGWQFGALKRSKKITSPERTSRDCLLIRFSEIPFKPSLDRHFLPDPRGSGPQKIRRYYPIPNMGPYGRQSRMGSDGIGRVRRCWSHVGGEKSGSARPSARKARPASRFVYLAILRAVRPLPREPSSRARESTKATLSRAAQKRPQAPRERPRGAREGRSARGHARLDRRGRTRPAPSFRGVTAAGRATRERTHRRDGVRGRRQGDALPGGNEM